MRKTGGRGKADPTPEKDEMNPIMKTCPCNIQKCFSAVKI